MSRSLRAILFDLHGTLGYVKKPVTAEEFCIYLQSRGYNVYPQSFVAAKNFVRMVAYPKCGYSNFADFYSEVLRMLDIKVEADAVVDLSKRFAEREQSPSYRCSNSATNIRDVPPVWQVARSDSHGVTAL
jgi:hypothetical protein